MAAASTFLICGCVHVYLGAFVSVQVYVHVCMYMCVCQRMCVCVYMHACVCMYLCVHGCSCTCLLVETSQPCVWSFRHYSPYILRVAHRFGTCQADYTGWPVSPRDQSVSISLTLDLRASTTRPEFLYVSSKDGTWVLILAQQVLSWPRYRHSSLFSHPFGDCIIFWDIHFG